MCDQQSLRSACANAQSGQSLCSSLDYSMSVKLLTKPLLDVLSLKGGCRGSSESTLVKIPHCWKSRITAHFYYFPRIAEMSHRSNSFQGTLRATSTLGRRNPDDPNSTTVRYDYSSTYIENEELDAELEGKTHHLQRSKYRASIEGDANLKIVKQNADELLSLKEKINKRDPNESSNKIRKFPMYNVSEYSETKDRGITESGSTAGNKVDVLELFDVVDGIHGTNSDVRHSSEQDSPVSSTKPMNTLTTFLLAFQKFKVSRLAKDQTKNIDEVHEDRSAHIKQKHITNDRITSLPNSANVIKRSCVQRKKDDTKYPKRPKSVHSSRIVCDAYANKETEGFLMRPVTAPNKTRRPSRRTPRSTSVSSEYPVYGINVQKDFTRSRRKLEEISRLEQDLKYKYVDKYEERRQRLLDSCKHNKTLDDRIQTFLHNIDEFKKTERSDSGLDRVLRKSKSAYIFRDDDRDVNA